VTKTQAVFYRDQHGHEPVDAFIDSLQRVAAQVAIDNAIDLLNGLSPSAPPLAFPHSSQLAGELRELRAHYGRTHYRILYQRSGSTSSGGARCPATAALRCLDVPLSNLIMSVSMDKRSRALGKTAAAGAAGRSKGSAAYRKEAARVASAAAAAKLIIHRRTELGISQGELASRMSTSNTQISRIESGRHSINETTLQRALRAMNAVPIMGYEVPAQGGRPARRELIAV
jgi:DNA-binding transcriptional regulator YiaG